MNPRPDIAAPCAAAADRRAERLGVWGRAWTRLRRDRLGMAALAVVCGFLALAVLVAMHLVAAGWSEERGIRYANPAFLGRAADAADDAVESAGPLLDIRDVDPLAGHYAAIERRAAALRTAEPRRAATLPFGGDRYGRDVLAKAAKGAEVSIAVGLAAALLATAIGTLLGAFAGFFGGPLGDLLEWLYNVFTAVPTILLIFAFAAILGRGIGSVVLILACSGWTGIYRLIRAEYLKHATREYVRAAQAIGAGTLSRMFVHILPNVAHVILVQLSLNVVAFIKAEVILSFLGLGVPVDSVSWGTMLNEAQSELVLGKWWQLAAATLFMGTFVTAFSLFTDALRDALDPRVA